MRKVKSPNERRRQTNEKGKRIMRKEEKWGKERMMRKVKRSKLKSEVKKI